MSEDRFFQQVKATMSDYSPEVPESVYTGMRKKLWWSNFTRLSATRFNVWYLAVLITGAVVAVNASSTAESGVSENSGQLPIISDASNNVNVVTENAPSAEPAEMGAHRNEQTSANNIVEAVPEIIQTDAKTDLPEDKMAGTNELLQASTTEVSTESASQNAQTMQTSDSKPGSKKGLKVKTYKEGGK